ncbi:hypothetical protein SKAU_G00150110 [Synaphobranchus kaupii]|uniref:Uncharacterized protein n=1 Tax=Synaphobranchus kaupii TaxID=118154 RepID=A0A9Q1FUZ9_SYNKA|nr:hypothetical protein SKAU_G00150110 [Synaphobranchus kaupii]
MSEGVQNPGDGGASGEDVPPGQSAFVEHDMEPHAQGAGARKCARKHKHQEPEFHQLQLQVQAMQQTLQGLLSTTASYSLYRQTDPQQSGTEEASVSGQESNCASELPPLDPSDRAVILRAAEHARLPPMAVPAPSLFSRGLQRRGQRRYHLCPIF